jgi:hypothetical protein
MKTITKGQCMPVCLVSAFGRQAQDVVSSRSSRLDADRFDGLVHEACGSHPIMAELMRGYSRHDARLSGSFGDCYENKGRAAR